jgi:hypothetical protein
MRHLSPALFASLLGLLGACNTGSSGGDSSEQSGLPGDEIGKPDGTFAYIDPNFSGKGSSPTLVRMVWGRLVDVYDQHPITGARQLIHDDLVIGEDVTTDGVDFEVETNVVTDAVTVTILHQHGTPGWVAAFARLDDALTDIDFKSDFPSELPPFSMVPRNAAISLQFSDLLDESTIGPDTVRVATGYPIATPFEARVLADPNFGALLGGSSITFHSTRVIVDLTTSEADVLEDGGVGSINALGLPPSIDGIQANVSVRIPTRVDFASGQSSILTNLSGSGVASGVVNSPVDLASPTNDVVRAFRSGSSATGAGDPNNGFLFDDVAPRLLASLPASVQNYVSDFGAGPDRWRVDLVYGSSECALAPKVGDVIRLTGAQLEVMVDSLGAPGGIVSGVQVRLLPGSSPTALLPTVGLVLTAYDAAGSAPESCFALAVPSSGTEPNVDVMPSSQVLLSFSEPIDHGTIDPYDSFRVATVASDPGPTEIVVGQAVPTVGSKGFVYTPTLPFSHRQGSSERYYLDVGAGVTDLAGNALANPLPQVEFTLDPAAPTAESGGIVLRFDSDDEDGNGRPELRGQLIHDFDRGVLMPRGVTHFAAEAARDLPMANIMQTLPHPTIPSPHDTGVNAPLTPLGSRMMMMWRYLDVGIPAVDENTYNVDVEGLSWVPLGGNLVSDYFPEFSMSLATCDNFPDDGADLATPGLYVPNSGMSQMSFEANVLNDPNNPLKEVHARGEGYLIDNGDLFLSGTGETLMPFPLNRGSDPSKYEYFTWRDTAVVATGGDLGMGIEPTVAVNTGQLSDLGQVGLIAGPGDIPSIGLPLLMDFKCYPTSSGLGLNTFDTLLAGFPTTFGFTAPPDFRVHSTGGFDPFGFPISKDPDLESQPDGGYSTVAPVLPVGTPTDPGDSLFYLGQVDLVTRISRVHTIWFDTGDTNPDYLTTVVQDLDGSLPGGTEIQVAYRGATSVVGTPLSDASTLDPYGDQPVPGGTPMTFGPVASKNPSVVFANGDSTWHDSVDAIDGARFVQLRITLVSDVASGASPELSSIGIPFAMP